MQMIDGTWAECHWVEDENCYAALAKFKKWDATTGKCFNCDGVGHRAFECKKPRRGGKGKGKGKEDPIPQQ